jgi:hypothetical protein
MKFDTFTAPTSPPSLNPMTDPRDLIQRMADEFECWIVHAEVEDIERAHKLVDEARAYLAQPEPTPECNEDYWRRDALESLLHAATSYKLNVYGVEELKIYEDRARAVLARWGK